jgi:hypothetical protein
VAQLVAHLLWEQGVGSSSLPIPTQLTGCDCMLHTAAARLFNSAKDVGELQAIADILGHSPEMLMTVYAHALPQSRQALVVAGSCQQLEGIVGGLSQHV